MRIRFVLAAVLIGADHASETYVGMKQKACRWVGMDSSVHRLSADATQADAEALVARLNADPAVSGILVQHPVPKHLHEPAILDLVSPGKDVDGISRSSLGGLINGEKPQYAVDVGCCAYKIWWPLPARNTVLL